MKIMWKKHHVLCWAVRATQASHFTFPLPLLLSDFAKIQTIQHLSWRLAYSGIFQHLSFFLSFSNKKVLRGILFYVSFIPCLGFSIEQEQNVEFRFLVMSNSAPSYWMGTWLIRFQHYYKSFERLQKNFFQRAAVEYCNVLP